jgi:hypothetical protein
MTKSKHGKYIITKPKKDIVVPEWGGSLSSERSTRVMYEDTSSPDPHTHDFDEVIAFFGTNRDDLNDLGAEIELWIDNEKNLMNETFLAFIPAGIVHCPLKILSIKRPVFHFAVGQGKSYA